MKENSSGRGEEGGEETLKSSRIAIFVVKVSPFVKSREFYLHVALTQLLTKSHHYERFIENSLPIQHNALYYLWHVIALKCFEL